MNSAKAKPPVERKVKAATAAAGGTAAAVSAVVLVLLTWLSPDMDDAAKVTIAAAVPGVLAAAGAFWAGYRARHTPRPSPPGPSNVTVKP